MVRGIGFVWEIRQRALIGLVRGRTLESLQREFGVSYQAIGEWAKIAGMTMRRGRNGGLVPVDTTRVAVGDPERSYRRLTLADRAYIQASLDLKDPPSYAEIARSLGVGTSTVSREIARHSFKEYRRSHYVAEVAHYRAQAKAHRGGAGKLEEPGLRSVVVAGLNQKHSPQQVAQRLRVDFPENPEMHVSHETIYQALYVQGRGALRHELTVEKALRSGRTGRKPQSKLPRRSSRPWLDGARLSDRPAEAEDRAVPGHWEGDLVVGPRNSGIVTLVERSTRFALIGRLSGARDSQTVTEVLQELISALPQELLRTITWDQGAEMASHRDFTVRTGCPVFFCDPHSPWQRGSNENLNGLIRDYYPKGTNFNAISDADITRMQDQLNDRPRMTLEWRTPREKITELITGVALAI